MNTNVLRKSLVVGIILLFIGVTIAPSINFNVVKASNDNDLVEVTTQACGIKGFGNTTVKLTRQQYQNLEQYLVDFRARLNKTTTREEAVPIFKEAVVELNKYGLLPKGMSVEKAQSFILDNIHKMPLKIQNEDYEINLFSLITGQLQNAVIMPGIFYAVTILGIWLFIILSVVFPGLIYLGLAFAEFMIEPVMNFIYKINQVNPLSINGIISHAKFSHFSGWVNTFGILGKKSWSGDFQGAVGGFKGFKFLVNSSESEYFFLGMATYLEMRNLTNI